MNKEPLISVVMSVYNTPIKYLKESIDSILAQTYKNFEFIIIDDGTTKEEVEFIKKYEDQRIKLYHNKQNLGLEKALNKGIELSNSEYIMRMDADDIAYPERFEKQINFILENPQYAIVGTRVDRFNDENGVYEEAKKWGEIQKKDFLIGPPFVHPTLCIKKDALEKIGGYPLYKRCEDYAMEFEMFCNGYKGYIMKDKLLKYRVVDGYKKRNLKNALVSCKLRWKYYRKINFKWYQYIWVLKPLATGKIFLFFKNIVIRMKRNNNRRENEQFR